MLCSVPWRMIIGATEVTVRSGPGTPQYSNSLHQQVLVDRAEPEAAELHRPVEAEPALLADGAPERGHLAVEDLQVGGGQLGPQLRRDVLAEEGANLLTPGALVCVELEVHPVRPLQTYAVPNYADSAYRQSRASDARCQRAVPPAEEGGGPPGRTGEAPTPERSSLASIAGPVRAPDHPAAGALRGHRRRGDPLALQLDVGLERAQRPAAVSAPGICWICHPCTLSGPALRHNRLIPRPGSQIRWAVPAECPHEEENAPHQRRGW